MRKWIRNIKTAAAFLFCSAAIPFAYEGARGVLVDNAGTQAVHAYVDAPIVMERMGINTAIQVGGLSENIAVNPNTAAADQANGKSKVIYSGGTKGQKEDIGPGMQSGVLAATGSLPAEGYLGGSKITLLANQTQGQMMSVLVESNQGKIIMIDGGVEGDANHLIDSIKNRGGHVDTWLVTHAHSDHVDALNYILRNPDCGVTVGNIYYSIPDLSWCYENEAYRADVVSNLLNTFATLPAEMLHGDIDKGQEIYVDNIKITVMNKPYLFSYNAINNSSVAFMLDINGKRALFLGDMGIEAGRQLLADYPDGQLKSDIVQMAHHGQNGVAYNVYAAVKPEVCLWPTPEWLWNNDSGSGVDSGSWKTLETRSWMAILGAKHHLCIKDGDQTLK